MVALRKAERQSTQINRKNWTGTEKGPQASPTGQEECDSNQENSCSGKD